MKETPACRKTGRGLLGIAASGPALRVKIRLRPASSHAGGEGRRSGRRCGSSPAASKQRGPLCGIAFAGRSGTEMLCCAFFQNAVLRWPKRGFSKNFAGRAPQGPGPLFLFFRVFAAFPYSRAGPGCGGEAAAGKRLFSAAVFQRRCFSVPAARPPGQTGYGRALPPDFLRRDRAHPLGSGRADKALFFSRTDKKEREGENPSRFSVFGNLAPPRGAQSLYFRPIGSSRKMRASISRRSGEMAGRTAICAQISRSRSTPGAISVSSRPWAVRRNTARSVK